MIPGRLSQDRHLRPEPQRLSGEELKTIRVLAIHVAATNKSSFGSLELAEK
jgi:hypothetical protein